MQYTALPTWSLAVILEASADLMLPSWQLTSVRRVNSEGWHEILSNPWKLTQIQPSDKSLENFQSRDFFLLNFLSPMVTSILRKISEKGKYVVLLFGIYPRAGQHIEVRKWCSWFLKSNCIWLCGLT